MRSLSMGPGVAAIVSVSLALGAAHASAQPAAPRQERVTFTAGASSATITGQVKGNDDVDYVVRAAAGQTLTVTLKPSNASTYFNVLPPGSDNVAMYNGQTGEPYTGTLPTDGEYRVRVYLMRNAARRGAASTYALTIGVAGKALPPLPSKQDAVVAGTSYHATGQIQCVAMPYGDKTPKPCDAGVIRRGTDGTATVEVSLGAAGKRRILFVQGKAVASDSMEKMTATRKGDVTTVTFESGESHQIPDALVTGG
jgi:hypothetical protein